MLRLLRPPLAASFLRSFRLHSPRYARETIAQKMLTRGALATAIMTQTGSLRHRQGIQNLFDNILGRDVLGFGLVGHRHPMA